MYDIPMSEVRTRNQACGRQWFAPGNTRFFSSRYSQIVYRTNDWRYVYFVTSEQYSRSTARMYTIRRMDWQTGNVENISDFMAYTNRERATRALEWAVAEYEGRV